MAKDFYVPWYSYGVFRFTREQIIWAISHRDSFDKGRWPREPSKYETDEFDRERKEWIKVIVESTFVDLIGLGQLKADAYFISPKTIWADVTRRLELTKTDGKLLMKEIESMVQPNYNGIEFAEARCALDYMSLFDFRKRPEYWQWRKRWRYYRKTKLKC